MKRVAMNCNRCGVKTLSTNRHKRHLVSTSRSKDSEESVSNRIKEQRMLLLLFLVSFTIFCCLSEWVRGGGNTPFQCSPVAHALVAPNDFMVRGGSKRMAMSQQPITAIFPSVALQRRDRLTQKQRNTRLDQQSNHGVETDREDLKSTMPTRTSQGKLIRNENNDKSSRRWFLTAAGTTTGLITTTLMLPASDLLASASSMEEKNKENGTDGAPVVARVFEYTEDNQTTITIPLAFTGQELLVAYKVDGSKFKAVLDTGSPFLMIPGSCGSNTRQKSGCYQNQGTPVPSLTPTIEIFDGFEGEVNWRAAPFQFWDVNNNDSIHNPGYAPSEVPLPKLQTQQQQQQLIAADTVNENNNLTTKKMVIFGVASEDIMGGPGGVFFGMIRDTDARIRPSFLGQTDVRAFRVNLATQPRTLTLSSRDLIAAGNSAREGVALPETTDVDYIPMTNLLRRRYGDPVGHYTALAQSIYVNGYPLVDTTIEKNSKILVIFDTGVTGMVVSRGLFDEQYMLARKRREKTLFGNVELTFSTALGKLSTLRANRPLATPFDPEQTWKKFPKRREGKKSTTHIIVMGLAFLEGRSLTVDIDEERLWVE